VVSIDAAGNQQAFWDKIIAVIGNDSPEVAKEIMEGLYAALETLTLTLKWMNAAERRAFLVSPITPHQHPKGL
jgi:hypothetical protein